MARKFIEIAFTPSVKAAQTCHGSRAGAEKLEHGEMSGDRLGEAEAAFIEARDGFYQATVNAQGWPYVQFRGGPTGFLKVLDERTIAYADFRGNVQYLSVGNLADNDRVALILRDYANKARLKVWARARIVYAEDEQQLLARLEASDYRARVERAVVMTIEAVDWNCPQHITPRYTEGEMEQLVTPLQNRIAELEAAAASSSEVAAGASI
jgi:predicted pyridoxine 5'-phosphate oxidase superfamily flavin-nucleotide-binding protein